MDYRGVVGLLQHNAPPRDACVAWRWCAHATRSPLAWSGLPRSFFRGKILLLGWPLQAWRPYIVGGRLATTCARTPPAQFVLDTGNADGRRADQRGHDARHPLKVGESQQRRDSPQELHGTGVAVSHEFGQCSFLRYRSASVRSWTWNCSAGMPPVRQLQPGIPPSFLAVM